MRVPLAPIIVYQDHTIESYLQAKPQNGLHINNRICVFIRLTKGGRLFDADCGWNFFSLDVGIKVDGGDDDDGAIAIQVSNRI